MDSSKRSLHVKDRLKTRKQVRCERCERKVSETEIRRLFSWSFCTDCFTEAKDYVTCERLPGNRLEVVTDNTEKAIHPADLHAEKREPKRFADGPFRHFAIDLYTRGGILQSHYMFATLAEVAEWLRTMRKTRRAC